MRRTTSERLHMPAALGRLAGAASLALTTWVAVAPTTASAAATPLHTITFRLTVNGTPPPADSFTVTWGETGLVLCGAPCAGDGHTDVRTETFPAGVTETFTFTRVTPPVSPEHPGQAFFTQTVTVTGDRTLSAFFTYGSASVTVPAAGAAPSVGGGALLVTAGMAVLLAGRRRRGRNGGRPEA